MLFYAGIDEAGYGPMLGPLCIGASLFRIDCDPADGPPNLWERLDSAVCRRPNDKKRRVAIDDSKTLKGAKGSKAHPLRHLERGVLAFLQTCSNELPTHDTALFKSLSAQVTDDPWYDGQTSLPLWGEAGEHMITGAQLKRAMEHGGVELRGMWCEVVHAHQINQAAQSRERKSDINLAAALRLAELVRSAHPDEHPRVVIDRQGGRNAYREHLALAWPDDKIQILGVTPRISRYRIESPKGLLTISFEAESELAHLPVALASMTAKLVRELQMARLNRFFAARLPELKPTAGYVQDGRRFMQEIDHLVESMALDQSRLVRVV